jgi:hypothetical protein
VKKVATYSEAVSKVSWAEVKRDIVELLDTDQASWPADELGIDTKKKSYIGLFVRLAWHCSGSYRESDGRGGCEGGRQRFEPELSWADNVNLIHAHRLLLPIKAKHGLGLSWGDLYIFAGTAAIEHAGGPVMGFCAGRYDDADGGSSVALGANFQVRAYSAPPHDPLALSAPSAASTFHLPPSTCHLAPSTLHLAPSTLHLPPCTFHAASKPLTAPFAPSTPLPPSGLKLQTGSKSCTRASTRTGILPPLVIARLSLDWVPRQLA